MKLKYLILVVIPLLFACTKTTEVIEEHYDNGAPKRVVTYEGEEDQRVKISSTLLYKSGKIQMEGKFKNNKRHGKWISYFENGSTWSIGSYNEGIRYGEVKVYYPFNTIHFEGQYEMDEPVGQWNWYKEDGSLDKVIDYNEIKK